MTREIEPPTLGRIRALLRERGLRPRRGLGQNFLTDPAMLERIVRAADLAPGERVLEVGPGPGTLTAQLLRAGARVVAVEIDPEMIRLHQILLGRPEHLTLIQADILESRPELPPRVVRALDLEEGGAYRLVANLPYQVAPTLLVDLFQNRPPRQAVVTVQWEVAERLQAAPGTRAYGPLGVLMQLRSRIELVRRIPPGAFWPPPRVESACLSIVPRDASELRELPPEPFLSKVVRAVFFARRKRLSNSLALAFRDSLTREQIDACLDRIHFEKERRGERLSPMEIVELARLLSTGWA